MKRDLRKYRKIDQAENDGEVDDSALGANPGDSDSEFENLKVKGSSRAKISHVSITKTYLTQHESIGVNFHIDFVFSIFSIFKNNCSKGILSRKLSRY